MSVLVGMNYLPFDHAEIRKKKMGPYEDQIINSLANAAQRYQQIQTMKQTHIAKMPSHYQHLKQHIFGGKK